MMTKKIVIGREPEWYKKEEDLLIRLARSETYEFILKITPEAMTELSLDDDRVGYFFDDLVKFYKGVKTENLTRIPIWREKAKQWDKAIEYFLTYSRLGAEGGDEPRYMLDWVEALRHNLKHVTEKLEVVKEFILSRREDIEQDIEDLGMLKPVLDHFLGAEE